MVRQAGERDCAPVTLLSLAFGQGDPCRNGMERAWAPVPLVSATHSGRGSGPHFPWEGFSCQSTGKHCHCSGHPFHLFYCRSCCMSRPEAVGGALSRSRPHQHHQHSPQLGFQVCVHSIPAARHLGLWPAGCHWGRAADPLLPQML